MDAMAIKALRHDSEQCQHVKENKYGSNAVFTHWIIAVSLEIGTKWSAQSRTRGDVIRVGAQRQKLTAA